MADQFDLFSAAPQASRAPDARPPGLRQALDFIAVDEEQALIAHIN